jgi:hypothetical protein
MYALIIQVISVPAICLDFLEDLKNSDEILMFSLRCRTIIIIIIGMTSQLRDPERSSGLSAGSASLA